MKKMKKIYINITEYANKYGLSLVQAHEEVQPFLFGLGYNWESPSYNKKVVLWFADYLELHMEKDWTITQCSSDSFVEDDYDYKWEIERTVTLRYLHRFIEHAQEIEYVEFNGKQYEKAKLEQALKLIEGDE